MEAEAAAAAASQEQPPQRGQEPPAKCKTRAKVYCLNDEGHWDDRGTGHVQILYLQVRARPTVRKSVRALLSAQPRAARFSQEAEAAFIVLTGEEESKELVKHKVNMDSSYNRQQGARVQNFLPDPACAASRYMPVAPANSWRPWAAPAIATARQRHVCCSSM